jgi:acyl-coenzyme A synthetase/AMP-(fatty) acid ligase
MNLRDLFNLSLVNRRDEAALEWKGEVYTFGEIDQRSDRMAAALTEHGLTQGDRVCV